MMLLVASAVCVWMVVGQGMKGGVIDGGGVGGSGMFVVGEGRSVYCA